MGDQTAIEWTDATWNPTRGCTRKSPGCVNCYAEIMAARFSGPGMWGEGFAEMRDGDHRWTGKVSLIDHQLDLPLRWREPRRIFVNSTSDLFHECLSNTAIAQVLGVMRDAHWHTYQVLTKRAERLPRFAGWYTAHTTDPLPRNLWLGVSIEDQERADERIPPLLDTPAAVRFLSVEPLIGPVGLAPWLELGGLNTDRGLSNPGIDWVIAGAESGLGARPCDLNWVRDIRDACATASVPFFYKQYAERGRKIPLPMLDGRQHIEFPA